MKLKLQYILFLFLCFTAFLNAQQQNDSLAKYSYQELRTFRKNYRNSNNELSKVYIDEYLRRSIVDNDTVRIYYGYFFLSKYYGNKKKVISSIDYLDSVIKYSKDKQDKHFPALSYLNKGAYLYDLGNNKAALRNFLKALEVLKINKNVLLELRVRDAIIALKTNWRANKETLNFKKENLQFIINNKESILDFEKTYLYALGNLSKEYIRNEKYKEGLETIIKGILESIKYKDTLEYYDFVSNAGAAKYYLGNYQAAIDSLLKALPYENDHGKAMSNYYLAKSFDKLKQPEKAQFHFLKTDSIYQATKDIFPEMRIAYEHIIDYYKSKNDTENQIKYYDRLLAADAKIDSTYKYVTETIQKKYETPQIIAERAALLEKVQNDKNSWKYSFGIISAVLFIILGVLVYAFRRQKYYKKRFEILMNTRPEALEGRKQKLEEQKNDLEVPESTIENILTGLSKFEDSEGFTKQTTLGTLAKKLKTNPKYLSKVINNHYEKNFSSYLNELRIQYIITKLKSDSKFRNYTIKAIAEEAGFGNTESFSKAFYKNTGISPSYFLKQLHKRLES